MKIQENDFDLSVLSGVFESLRSNPHYEKIVESIVDGVNEYNKDVEGERLSGSHDSNKDFVVDKTGSEEAKVVIFGAGLAGLACATELVLKGYQVVVYEKGTVAGGKARSYLNDTSVGPLPGEHGFRFIMSECFYDSVHRYLRFTPSAKKNTAHDHLIDVPESLAFYISDIVGKNPKKAMLAYLLISKVVFPCEGRRLEDDKITFEDFLLAENERYGNIFSNDEIQRFASSPTMLQATKTKEAPASCGSVFHASLADEKPLMILDGPTSDVWINPWVEKLESMGVEFVWESSLIDFNIPLSTVNAAVVKQGDDYAIVHGDYYVVATPHESVPEVVEKRIPKGLGWMRSEWMCGVQFYIDSPLSWPKGHVSVFNSPWKVTAIQQSQLWPEWDSNRNPVILSAIISCVNSPGVLYGKSFCECTKDEAIQEIWAQLSMDGLPTEAKIIDVKFADGIKFGSDDRVLTHEEPLYCNRVGESENAPDIEVDSLTNLFICGDWVKSPAYMVCMEAACRSGRIAADLIDVKYRGVDESVLEEKMYITKTVVKNIGLPSLLVKIDEQLFKNNLPCLPHLIHANVLLDLVEAFPKKLVEEVLNGEKMPAALLPPKDLVESVSRIVDKNTIEILIRSIGSGAKINSGKNQNNYDYRELVESVKVWANISIDKKAVNPSSVSNFFDVEDAVFAPINYLLEGDGGGGHRIKAVLAFSYWLPVDASTLIHCQSTIQLLHNCSLLVDDFYDETDFRRSKKSAHLKFGSAETIGAAYTVVFQAICSSFIHLGVESTMILVEELARAHHSNAKEIVHRNTRACPNIGDYLAIVDGKTGSAFRSSIRILVKLTNNTIDDWLCDKLSTLGTLIGRLFQITDDYLDITSDSYKLKKGVLGSDILEGKFSYPIICAIRNSPELKKKLDELYGKEITNDVLNHVLVEIKKHGGIRETENVISGLYLDCIEIIDLVDSNIGDGYPNVALRKWIDNIVKDVPSIQRVKKSTPKSKYSLITDIDYSLDLYDSQISRALRETLIVYSVYVNREYSDVKDIWASFPFVYSFMLFSIVIDDSNETGGGIDVLNRVSNITNAIPDFKLLLEDAKSYYHNERLWIEGSKLDLSFEGMNRIRSTHFKVAHKILDLWFDDRLYAKYENEKLRVLEDYVSLALDFSSKKYDAANNTYNTVNYYESLCSNGLESSNITDFFDGITCQLHEMDLLKVGEAWVDQTLKYDFLSQDKKDEERLSFSLWDIVIKSGEFADVMYHKFSCQAEKSIVLGGDISFIAEMLCAIFKESADASQSCELSRYRQSQLSNIFSRVDNKISGL